MGQIVEKTLETIGKTRGAYCQIVGAEISAHTCLTTQGQSGCFGCASSYRFCELCSERLVAVSAVGLCSACFKTEVKREQKIGKPSFPSGFKVRCQLLSRNIKTAMCEATQGQEGCRNCPAPSRLCEKCKERAVRFPRYGFCLHCSVAEFGGDEKQMLSDKEESQLREIRSKLSLKLPKTENGGGESKVFETSKPVAADSTQSDREKQEDRPQRVGERRVRFEGGKIKITLVAKKPDHFAELVDRAERLVKRHGYASTLFLERKLLITNGVAKKVLNSLEERGVVGSKSSTRSREVLKGGGDKRLSPDSITEPASSKSKASCQLCKKPVYSEPLGLCKSHAFRYYAQKRAERLATGEDWKSRAEKVLPKARATLKKRGKISRQYIKSTFHAGSQVAGRVLQLLEEERLIGPSLHAHPRKLLRDKPGVGCYICGEGAYARARLLCSKHYFWLYRVTHTKYFLEKDGRSQAEKYLPIVRRIFSQRGEIESVILRQVLDISERVVKGIMALLAEEGLTTELAQPSTLRGPTKKAKDLLSSDARTEEKSAPTLLGKEGRPNSFVRTKSGHINVTGATFCLICDEEVFVDSRGVCERHSQKIYDFHRTRHFQTKDGRTKAEKFLPLARDILLEKGEISGLLLRRVLQINKKVARAIVVLLENEGLIKAPARSRVARLIENPEKGVTVKKRPPKALSPKAKSVEDLAAVVGKDSDLAKVLRSLAVDSAELKRLKTRLKNVLGDDGTPTKKAP